MEGPSLKLLVEELKPFLNKNIIKASGTASIPFSAWKDSSFKAKSWGKHLILENKKTALRIHFLMFGSYRINSKRPKEPKLSFKFKKGEINFYTCAVKEISQKEIKAYDWEVDVLSKKWNARKAHKKLLSHPKAFLCDILMDQSIFAGVGNIIKNEVLYNLSLHPAARVDSLSATESRDLIKEVRTYCEKFLYWKRRFELKRNWKIFRKRKCPQCKKPVAKVHLGKLKRVSYYCKLCQPIKK